MELRLLLCIWSGECFSEFTASLLSLFSLLHSAVLRYNPFPSQTPGQIDCGGSRVLMLGDLAQLRPVLLVDHFHPFCYPLTQQRVCPQSIFSGSELISFFYKFSSAFLVPGFWTELISSLASRDFSPILKLACVGTFVFATVHFWFLLTQV